MQLAFPHSAAPMLITLMRRFLRSPSVSGIFHKTQTRVCLSAEQYFLRPSNSVAYLEKPKHSLVVVLETGSTASCTDSHWDLPQALAAGKGYSSLKDAGVLEQEGIICVHVTINECDSCEAHPHYCVCWGGGAFACGSWI